MKEVFPKTLLDEPHKNRIAYFVSYTAQHPLLDKATAELFQAIDSQVRDTIIFVYGPTGVGKTTLCKEVVKRVIAKKLTDPNFNRAKHIPVAFLESATPEKRQFDWKDFYQQAMHAIQSALFEKADPVFIKHNPRLSPALYFNWRLKPCEHRTHFIHSIRARNPQAIFVDEAQNFGKVTKGEKLLDQMDVLKTIASFSPAKLVLIGPYELLKFRNLSGQLSRRSRDIHFGRYKADSASLSDFQSVIWTFQKQMPLEVEPDFINHWEYLYTKSVGCVGTLKDWLTRSLEIALSQDKKTVCYEILRSCALSDDQSENIALEIVESERLIEGGLRSYNRLQVILGLREPEDNYSSLIADGGNQEKTVGFNFKDSKRSVLPGRRKAKRDLIG